MNKNVDIFICTHKDFDEYPNNSTYKIICGEEQIKNKYPLEVYEDKPSENDIYPLEYSYAEGSRFYWLWKNYNIKDYIGFCHYRKYFEFYDNVLDINEIFKQYDVILGQPMKIGNVYGQYAYYHNAKDLVDISTIIFNNYSDYKDTFIQVLNNEFIFPCNMFIMKKDDFNKYCEFVFGVLKEYNNLHNFKTIEDINAYVKNNSTDYLKNFSPNDTVEYQSRINGYLLERLTNVFIFKHFKKPYVVNLIETNGKYGKNIFKKKEDLN